MQACFCWVGFSAYLEHLFDFPAWQIDIELVEKLVNFINVQEAITIFISFFKRLLHPRHK